MGSLPDWVRSGIALAIVAGILWWLAPDPPSDMGSWALGVFLMVLLVGFWAALFRYRQPYAHTARTLRKAKEELDGSDLADVEADGDADVRRSPPDAFKGHESLQSAWDRFAAARSRSGSGPLPTRRSTVSPTDHFTIDTVLARNPGRLPDALPGVFTAVGLLGTFVGIALGLADIEPTAGTEDLMEGIRTLMGGMSTAFLTSIVGITWSVWWLFEWRLAER